MKNYFLKLFIIALSLSFGQRVAICAFEVDGIYYELKNNHAIVIGNGSNTYSGSVVIPSTVKYKNKTYEVQEINKSAFLNSINMTSISLPTSISDIGDNAFKGCSKLDSVTLDCILSLELYKYFGTQVKNYVLGENWTIIRKGTFSNCRDMIEISIPTKIKRIEENAFEECSGLSKVIVSDLTAWCKISFGNELSNPLYLGHNLYNKDKVLIKELALPSNVRWIENYAFCGCSFTKVIIQEGTSNIFNGVFKNCKELADVVMPDGLFIGDAAFDGCEQLAINVKIADGQNTIGVNTFRGCRKIQSVSIPQSVLFIKDNAFRDCSSLLSLSIPKNVCELANAFEGCSGLKSIVVDEANPVYNSQNGCDAIIGTFTKELIIGCSNTIIPSDITSISDSAFCDCKELTVVTIPSKVKSIGNAAFWGCIGVEKIISEIEAPFPVTDSTFQYSENGELHTLNATLFVPLKTKKDYLVTKGWKQFGTILEKGNGCFTALTEEGVEMMFKIIDEEEKTCKVGAGESPYHAIDINTVGNVHIPPVIDGYNVIGISDGAFGLCDKIRMLKIPGSVKEIGTEAFYGCTGLKFLVSEISNPSDLDYYTLKYDDGHSEYSLNTVLIVPSGTKDAYLSKNGWNQLYIVEGFMGKTPEGIDMAFAFIDSQNKECMAGLGVRNNQMATSVFQDVNGEITIPSEINGFSVTSIAESAFDYCEGITKINLSNNIKSINRAAFRWCTNLETIQMSDKLSKIGEYAFYGCESIKSLSIPSSVTEIEHAAFSDCKNLVKVSIPQSITTINDAVFRRCISLENIIIPSQVSFIGNAAFYECSALTNITSLNPTPPVLHEEAFTSYNAKLHVPYNSKATYQNAEIWKNFANIIEIESVGIKPVKGRQKEENCYYDLSGRRLSYQQKGINIINGKKVIVK